MMKQVLHLVCHHYHKSCNILGASGNGVSRKTQKEDIQYADSLLVCVCVCVCVCARARARVQQRIFRRSVCNGSDH